MAGNRPVSASRLKPFFPNIFSSSQLLRPSSQPLAQDRVDVAQVRARGLERALRFICAVVQVREPAAASLWLPMASQTAASPRPAVCKPPGSRESSTGLVPLLFEDDDLRINRVIT